MNKFLIQSVRVIALVALLVGTLISFTPSIAADDLYQTQGFRKGVILAGIREHQAAPQAIAEANVGNRLAGTEGYDESAQYVYDRMTVAGYAVNFQEFSFLLVSDRTPPVFQQLSPIPRMYVDGPDIQTMQYSGSGDWTAAVTAVDLIVPSPAPTTSTSGCEAADFAGFPVGTIALMQRGTCTFRVKAENAVAAGAVGVIIMDEGNPGPTAALGGTLGAPLFSHPVIGTSFSVGDELRYGVLNGPTGATARLKTDTVAEARTTRNVIAETPTGNPNSVIVVGAHP